MATFQSGKVALSFVLRTPEVADGGPPHVGRYGDQVTETGLAPTQHTDEDGAQRLTRAEPREDTCNIADLQQLFRGGAHSRRSRSSLWQRNHDSAHERCKSSLQACRGATLGILP